MTTCAVGWRGPLRVGGLGLLVGSMVLAAFYRSLFQRFLYDVDGSVHWWLIIRGLSLVVAFTLMGIWLGVRVNRRVRRRERLADDVVQEAVDRQAVGKLDLFWNLLSGAVGGFLAGVAVTLALAVVFFPPQIGSAGYREIVPWYTITFLVSATAFGAFFASKRVEES